MTLLAIFLGCMVVAGAGGTVVVGPKNVKALAIEQMRKNPEFNRYMKVREAENREETYALEMERRERQKTERQLAVEADFAKFDDDLDALVLPASINSLIREVDSQTEKDDDEAYWTETGAKAMKLVKKLANRVARQDGGATFEDSNQATKLHRVATIADQKLSKIKRAKRLTRAQGLVAEERMMLDKYSTLAEWKNSLDRLVGANTQIMYNETEHSLTLDEQSVLGDIKDLKVIVEENIEVARKEARRKARELEEQLAAEREVVRQQALAHQAKLVAEAEARRKEAIARHQEEARRAASQYADRYGRAKRRMTTPEEQLQVSTYRTSRARRFGDDTRDMEYIRAYDGSVVAAINRRTGDHYEYDTEDERW